MIALGKKKPVGLYPTVSVANELLILMLTVLKFPVFF